VFLGHNKQQQQQKKQKQQQGSRAAAAAESSAARGHKQQANTQWPARRSSMEAGPQQRQQRRPASSLSPWQPIAQTRCPALDRNIAFAAELCCGSAEASSTAAYMTPAGLFLHSKVATGIKMALP